MTDDDSDIPPMPWTTMRREELLDAARLAIRAGEDFVFVGERIPEELRIDLAMLTNVDDVPHDLRMRAARLVAQQPN